MFLLFLLVGSPLESAETLTLAEAWQLTLSRNPELEAGRAQLEISRGELIQVGLRPNPELSLAGENLFGKAENRGLRGAETSLNLSQALDPFGKRQARIEVFQRQQKLNEVDLEEQTLVLREELGQAFFQAIAAQEALSLQQQKIALARELSELTRERVTAGRERPAALRLAEMELDREKILALDCRRLLVAARRRLGLFWDAAGLPTAATPPGWLAPRQIPSLSELLDGLENYPGVRRGRLEEEWSQAKLAAARKAGLLDLSLNGGLKKEERENQTSLQIGLEMELPVFDRNQGNQHSVRATADRLKAMAQARRQRLSAELKEAYEATGLAQEEATRLQTAILPRARQNLEDLCAGYQQGRFDLLILNQARIRLAEIQARLIACRLTTQQRRLQLERLSGLSL
ncbi:MAG: TolC family protein [Deltaproteobacteria bacterium]|nr:TolC family protein [Deltaproteobacteria bacterium]